MDLIAYDAFRAHNFTNLMPTDALVKRQKLMQGVLIGTAILVVGYLVYQYIEENQYENTKNENTM